MRLYIKDNKLLITTKLKTFHLDLLKMLARI